MKKKHTYKLNTKNICITIPIETDDYLRKFILDNAHMYNKIRNDFVDEANKYIGECNMYYDFNPREFKIEYYNTIEVPENRYATHCVGLSEQISENFVKSKKTIQTKNKKILRKEATGSLGEYKIKAFNYNRYTFRVKLKPDIHKGVVRGRFKVKDKNNVIFKVRSKKFGRPKEVINIKLLEDLYDDIIDDFNPTFIKHYTFNGITNEYAFYLTDIKDIAFKYDVGKYYIQLFVTAHYFIDKRALKEFKGNIAGIDTGICHPVTLYDGNRPYYFSMDDKTTRKIHYLERRIKRLQHYKDIKWQYNFDHGLNTHSNNIIKMVKKIRKLYKRSLILKTIGYKFYVKLLQQHLVKLL